MNQGIEPASISVSTVFGRRAYFPEITLNCLGDRLIVTATLTQKLERLNGWTPTIVMEMIKRVTAPGIVFGDWEVEREPSLREWSVIGMANLLLVGDGNIL